MNNHEAKNPEPQGRNGANRPKPTSTRKPSAPHQGEKRFSRDEKPSESSRRPSDSRYPTSRRPSEEKSEK